MKIYQPSKNCRKWSFTSSDKIFLPFDSSKYFKIEKYKYVQTKYAERANNDFHAYILAWKNEKGYSFGKNILKKFTPSNKDY